MAQSTQPYKRSLAGSVGAGMKSVFGGEGRRFYTLVHKVSSKYHQAGEAQKIIVDQIEIGRDPACQVRFDENFGTVSRRHAAIVKDGSNWKLVQLSKTNSTFLNGHKVQDEWYLQNGDEIQLSTNGPKLGFIIPEGKQGLVGSIGLTARLNLFRQQALRPYKTALWSLALVMIVAVGLMGIFLKQQSNTIDSQTKLIAQGEEQINNLIDKMRKKDVEIDNIRAINEEMRIIAKDAARRAAEAEEAIRKIRYNPSDIDFSDCFKDIYFIKLYKITCGGDIVAEVNPDRTWLMCGTGFMLNDGRFITARHVIDPSCYSNDYFLTQDGWHFNAHDIDDLKQIRTWMSLNAAKMTGLEIVFYYKAFSNLNTISFTSNDFKCDRSKDKVYRSDEDLVVQVGGEKIVMLDAGSMIRFGATGSMDWGYLKTSGRGELMPGSELSGQLRQGTHLYIVGYPRGRGEGNPILSTAICSQNGLDNDGTIMASNDNTEGGNSGGPVFIIDSEGNKRVIGLVSGATGEKGRFVPINAVK